MRTMKKILFIICCIFAITGCGGKTESDNLNQGNQTYKLNDTINLENSKGKMALKFLSVTETEDRNEFWHDGSKRVIFIKYYYENINLNDDFYIDENNFKIYDKENRILETYPLNVDSAPAISAGRKATHEIAYGLNSDENYIEIELKSQKDNTHLNKKVILEW